MKKNKRKNILILESMFQSGGIEKLIYSITEGLNREKYNIIICTLYQPGPMGGPFIKKGYKFYHNLIKNRFDIRAFFKLNRIINHNKIDLIYLVTQPLTIFWGFIIGKIYNIPIICLIGNTIIMSEHFKLNIFKLMLPFVDKIIAQADLQKHHWVREVGIPEKLISVINNGIEIKENNIKFNKNEKLKSLQINDSNKIVGIVGRLVRLKGVDIFLRAAKIICEKDNRIYFLIVGEGPEMQQLKSLAHNLGIDNKVNFLGFRNDLFELIDIFDIAVLSSRTEAMPMVLLEYMVFSKAIVATEVGSVSELIINGYNGLLVKPENPDALAEKILFFIENEDKRLMMGNNGKKLVQKKFRIEKAIEKTELLMDEVINKKNKRMFFK